LASSFSFEIVFTMAGIEKLPTSMPPSPSFDETYACYCALVGVDIDIGSFVLFEDKQGQTSDNGPASCHAVGRLLKLSFLSCCWTFVEVKSWG
jgi:hypothetical protein